VPSVFIGEPACQGRDKYLTAEMDGIKIFYSPNLRVRPGFSEIHIDVKRFLFLAWLEIEGAKAIPVFNE
jgi:hypothetical protein